MVEESGEGWIIGENVKNAELMNSRLHSHLLLYMQWETIQGFFNTRIPKQISALKQLL